MDLVNSLFGLPPQEQLRQQQLSRDVGLGGLFAAATVNPYAAPSVQDAYLKQQQAQFALGSMGARGLGSLFGFKDPELQRVSTLEGILQGVSEEVDINNPVQFYPTLQKRLQEAGFSQEAAQVGMAGQEAIQNFALNQAKTARESGLAKQIQTEITRESDLRDALAKLPENYTEEDYLNVVRQFASPDKVLPVIERGLIAKENRQQRLEEIKLRAQEQRTILEMRLEEQGLRQDERLAIQAQIANMNNQTRLAIAEMNNQTRQDIQASKPKQLSPAEKRVDAKFGEEYASYIANGGKSVVDRQLNELDAVINMAEQGKAISGPGIAAAGALGDVALSTYSKDALEARDRIGGVVQSNLRAILGGQFAQKEGEALLARAFNPAAPVKDNLKRLKSLREQIAKTVESKEAAVQYYEENGTLAGFKGNTTIPKDSGKKKRVWDATTGQFK